MSKLSYSISRVTLYYSSCRITVKCSLLIPFNNSRDWPWIDLFRRTYSFNECQYLRSIHPNYANINLVDKSFHAYCKFTSVRIYLLLNLFHKERLIRSIKALVYFNGRKTFWYYTKLLICALSIIIMLWKWI